MEKFKQEIDSMDSERADRIKQIDTEKKAAFEKEHARREALRAKANQIREETGQEYDDDALLEACAYYDIPPFTIDMGKNDWENRFLNDMRNRIVNRRELSEKQLNALLNIIDPQANNDVVATAKQKRYIERLGGTVEEGLTKQDASEMIGD